MIRTTLNIIGSQICELWQQPCTYSRLFLAPIVASLLLTLGNYVDATVLAKMTTSHGVYLYFLNAIVLANLILVFLTPFYAIKSIIELMRYQVLDESPRRYFGIYWVKQSYLVISYLYLAVIFTYCISMVIYNPIPDPLWSGFFALIGVVLALLYAAFILTAYPMNLVAVATDIHTDFFKIFKQIGPWRWSILIIKVLYVLTLIVIIAFISWLQSMNIATPDWLATVIIYLVSFITMGAFAKVFKLHQESR